MNWNPNIPLRVKPPYLPSLSPLESDLAFCLSLGSAISYITLLTDGRFSYSLCKAKASSNRKAFCVSFVIISTALCFGLLPPYVDPHKGVQSPVVEVELPESVLLELAFDSTWLGAMGRMWVEMVLAF